MYFLFQCTILLGQSYGGWIQIDSMKEARYNHSSIQLANGNVLVVGGAGLADQSSCEIYSLSENLWRKTSSTNFRRGRQILIMLKSGRILTVGSSVTKLCEIYYPDSCKWKLTDSLNVKRVLALHQVVMLSDGRILVIGGRTYDYPNLEEQTLKMCEVYDETTGKWDLIDSLAIRRSSHSATLLKDGRVLVAGGGISPNSLASCELYDPILNKWTEAAPMNIGRESHNAVLLPDGKVLVIGGYAINNLSPTRSCEIYDPTKNKWTIVDSTGVIGSAGSAFILDDRNILLVGANENQYLVWEIYDYVDFRSKYYGYVNTHSFTNNKLQLSDGRVLISGGVTTNDYSLFLPVKKCWIFDKNLTHIRGTNDGIKEDIFFQNYPNPFNSSTTIKFFISKTSDVKITIYNILGEKVQELINERKEQGFHEILFAQSNLSSGIYYCNITINKKVVTKKLLILK
jgi:hypothetical protein